MFAGDEQGEGEADVPAAPDHSDVEGKSWEVICAGLQRN